MGAATYRRAGSVAGMSRRVNRSPSSRDVGASRSWIPPPCSLAVANREEVAASLCWCDAGCRVSTVVVRRATTHVIRRRRRSAVVAAVIVVDNLACNRAGTNQPDAHNIGTISNKAKKATTTEAAALVQNPRRLLPRPTMSFWCGFWLCLGCILGLASTECGNPAAWLCRAGELADAGRRGRTSRPSSSVPSLPYVLAVRCSLLAAPLCRRKPASQPHRFNVHQSSSSSTRADSPWSIRVLGWYSILVF